MPSACQFESDYPHQFASIVYWDDDGKQRRYVPDFYLPKYDLYLDPKNDYLIKKIR